MTSRDHPIPIGRWAALHDDTLWVPMKGIVSRTAVHYALTPEMAGEVIARGMESGIIGHRPVQGHTWVVAPRAAELARLSGFSYDDQMDWREGCVLPPGGAPISVEVFWPDVERAVASAHDAEASAAVQPRPTQAEVTAWLIALFQRARDQGRPPPKRSEEAFFDCRRALGASETQMREAMKQVPANLKRRKGDKDPPLNRTP